jgi:SAM-dependent methyltransferase
MYLVDPRTPIGLPAPPPELAFLVTGEYNSESLLFDGNMAFHALLAILRKNDIRPEDFRAILDFGCGCGRILRYFHSLKNAQIHGTDYNPDLLDWCRRYLYFGEFRINGLFPPSTYEDDQFDFIYAISVFTHWPESLQLLWMKEFWRILRPGAHLLMTAHSELKHYAHFLSDAEREAFQTGRLVVKCPESHDPLLAAGTNFCCTFHPVAYVRETLATGFEVTDHVKESWLAGPQSAYLLRKSFV